MMQRCKAITIRASVVLALIIGTPAMSSADAATVPGVTPGSLAVSERGQASYSIPVAVPPGIAGMEPSLALNYSSGGGNGILGMGWSLGGLSVIHRCPATVIQDNFADAVDYDGRDRFCLDGKRLMGIGTGGYGSNGKGYRTELDGFFKVESRGTVDGGPKWFKIWTKSGQIMEYGNTVDSRIEAKGRSAVRVWAVNKIADTVGNYMTLSYVERPNYGSYRIDRIDYTHNDAAGVSAKSSVWFQYEDRPDVARGYLGGSAIRLHKRMTGIKTYVGSDLVRDYRLAYNSGGDSNRSRLLRVTECDGANLCISPQTFTWTAKQNDGFKYAPFNFSFVAYNYQPKKWKGKMGEFIDANGDGLTDWVQAYEGASGTKYQSTRLSTGSGFKGDSGYQAPFIIHDHSYGGHRRSGLFADLDGDALPDFVQAVRHKNTQTLKTYMNKGNRWRYESARNPRFLINDYRFDPLGWRQGEFADVDGDGRTDFVEAISTKGITSRDELRWPTAVIQRTWRSTASGWKESTAFKPPFLLNKYEQAEKSRIKLGSLVDVNGDGLPDFIQAARELIKPRQSPSYYVYYQKAWLNTGNGWKVSAAYQPPFWANLGAGQLGEYRDLNGDGLVDFFWAYRLGNASPVMKTWLNTGDGWAVSDDYKLPSHVTYFASGPDRRLAEFVDVNGDNRPDFVQAYKNSSGNVVQKAWLNTGTGWKRNDAYAPANFVFDNYDTSPPRREGDFADIDGDGRLDWIKAYTNGAGSKKRQAFLAKVSVADLIVKVTDSLGTDTLLTYKPLTDKSVYEKFDTASYPRRDMQTALYVVSEVSRDNGVGGQARTRYHYSGATADLKGRGFLGFQWVEATDLQTGLVTSTRYKRSFPFTGQVAYSETYFPHSTNGAQDKLLRSVTSSWAEKSLHGGATHFPYIAQSVAKNYEVNDGWGNGWITKVTTTSNYDNLGNPTKIVVTTQGGGETFVTTTVNSYDNDRDKWHLGRLTRASVTNQLPDQSTQTRVSGFGYFPASGILRREIIEPGGSLALTTTYGYDDFGNQTTVTVSGADIVSRVTTTGYSPNGRFPISVTNALGHRETRSYDGHLGTVTRLTGPNNLTTTWEYDGLGRKVLEKRADGTQTDWFYSFCNATNPCPAGSVYQVHAEDSVTTSGAIYNAVTREYFDALNRVFSQEIQGFEGTPVYSDTVFNGRGEVKRVSKPYFQGGPILWTQTTYDDIGRPVSVTLPNGCATTTDYDGLTTTATNCLTGENGQGQREIRVNDALGRLAKVVDADLNEVRYSYDHFGNLTATEVDPADVLTIVRTVMTYDIRGHKTAMDDPDMGVWAYQYNVLGELVAQTDAKLQTVTMIYDKLGRMTGRTEDEGTTTWRYDAAVKGIGKLTEVRRSQDDYLKTHAYDSLGRPQRTEITYEGETYVTSQTYDEAGRVALLSYPAAADGSHLQVENLYHLDYGYLEAVREVGAVEPYWRLLDANAEGQVTGETLGNGVSTLRDFDPATGLLEGTETSKLGVAIQDNGYSFDPMGNLTARADRLQDLRETFAYDRLNRLTEARVYRPNLDPSLPLESTATSYAYDGHGNLTFKSDVGAYLYGSGIDGGPHAVTAVSGAVNKVYAYDANGSMTATAPAAGGDSTRSVAWSSFNKPVAITNHLGVDGTSNLIYGPGRARIRQEVVELSGTKIITYIGGSFERHAKAGKADELVHYIRAGSTVAIFTKLDDGDPASDKTRYLHKDHLGSVELITDEAGVVVENDRRAFDPHGALRKADTWLPAAGSPAMAETKRGFTGHEHLTSVGLIHMNGRVYDPEIGRFLSADPFVQAPETTQSFNRYSYVNNNPLSYTDPSGFFFKKLFKGLGKIGSFLKSIIPTIATIAIVAVVSLACGPAALVCAAVAAASMAFITTMSYGGSATDALTGAAISAGTSLAFAGLHFFNPTTIAGQLGKVIAHGTVGGLSSKLRGGNFARGFLSAAAVQGFTQAGGFKAIGLDADKATEDFGERIKNAAVSAVVGGTASVIGGGKFANGAVTGSFSRLFNDVLKVGFDYKTPFGIDTHPDPDISVTGGSVGLAIGGPEVPIIDKIVSTTKFNDAGVFISGDLGEIGLTRGGGLGISGFLGVDFVDSVSAMEGQSLSVTAIAGIGMSIDLVPNESSVFGMSLGGFAFHLGPKLQLSVTHEATAVLLSYQGGLRESKPIR